MESRDTRQIAELVQAARAGDQHALRELIAWAMDYLFPAVLTMLRDRHARGTYVTDVLHQGGPDLFERIHDDAWEITHLACCRMATRLDSFRGRGAFGQPVQFSTWLYAIARNEMRNIMRSRWREQKRRHVTRSDPMRSDSTMGDTTGAPADTASTAAAPDEQLIDEFERDLLREALREAPLTPEQRQAVLLFHGLGYRQERIAAMTGVQIGTVKKRIFDGLRKLRAYVQERSEAPPKGQRRDGHG